MAARLEGTVSAASAIARVRYSHDGMIDLIVAQPMITQNEIAKHFGYTPAWVSRIINSDAFQERLALRKTELVDPSIVASVDEKLRTLASKSLDVVLEKLIATNDAELGLRTVEVTTKALGYGARSAAPVQQNFVVAMPAQAVSGAAWEEAYRGQKPKNVIDVDATPLS